MSAVSSLPIELWHQILRFICESSLSSDILLQDYPWVNTLRSTRCRTATSALRGAMVRNIGQVCRSWNMFARQLGYQEIELRSFARSFRKLLMEHQSCSGVFNETRRLSVQVPWSDNTRDLLLLVQSMPRLEWLHFTIHGIQESQHLHIWLPSLLKAQPCLLYLDLNPLHYSEPVFIDSECISIVSNLAVRLRRLTCAIEYVPSSSGQVQHAPRFQCLQVLQMIDIHCDAGHKQAACEWFSNWHLPSLQQFLIPHTWEYCTKLLDKGVGAQVEVLGASVRAPWLAQSPQQMTQPQQLAAVPKQLWPLCPQVHTVITSRNFPLPLEPRRRLHCILVYPFRRWATGFETITLASLLTSLSSMRAVHPGYTFSLQHTELSWQGWAETSSGPGTVARIRSTLMQWKRFAETHQMEVLDGYGIDIRDVTILPPTVRLKSMCWSEQHE